VSDESPFAGSPPGASTAQERRVRRAVAAGTLAVRALASTWRLRVVHDAPLRKLRAEGRPVIFACWHGELLPLLWHHREQGIRILVSEHRDGEIIARVAARLGFGAVRGSTTRGGGRALLGLVRALEEGHDVAVTPDGPRGPAHAFAPGALVAAQRAGAPIVPVGAYASRAWRMRSWDRFLVPQPLARVVVAYAEPTWVDAASARDAAAETQRFAALQHVAVARAYEAAGRPPPSA
jgi:lysophospholipid acyltransferase (LPLAT)-like uncharacterized protein